MVKKSILYLNKNKSFSIFINIYENLLFLFNLKYFFESFNLYIYIFTAYSFLKGNWIKIRNYAFRRLKEYCQDVKINKKSFPYRLLLLIHGNFFFH